MVRKSYFLKSWILLISLKRVSRFNFGRFVSKSDNFLGQVCILGAVDLNWRKMFILMSLETGFDHNHFGEKDIIVLFWLFHSNIESFRVLTAFFLLREFKIKYGTEFISKISEDPVNFRENLKFRSCFGKKLWKLPLFYSDLFQFIQTFKIDES